MKKNQRDIVSEFDVPGFVGMRWSWEITLAGEAWEYEHFANRYTLNMGTGGNVSPVIHCPSVSQAKETLALLKRTKLPSTQLVEVGVVTYRQEPGIDTGAYKLGKLSLTIFRHFDSFGTWLCTSRPVMRDLDELSRVWLEVQHGTFDVAQWHRVSDAPQMRMAFG